MATNSKGEIFYMEIKNKKIIDSYDYLAKAASTTDCTGLMPTPALSNAEHESYQELYPFTQTPIQYTKKKK